MKTIFKFFSQIYYFCCPIYMTLELCMHKNWGLTLYGRYGKKHSTHNVTSHFEQIVIVVFLTCFILASSLVAHAYNPMIFSVKSNVRNYSCSVFRFELLQLLSFRYGIIATALLKSRQLSEFAPCKVL